MKTEFYFDDESIYEKEKRLVKRLDYVYVMPLLSLLSIIQVHLFNLFFEQH